jgi:predicted lipid-binding transport protein (Tim44 family)
MSESQLIILGVAAAVVAVGVFVRLFMVLGRRNEVEPPPRVPGWAGGGQAEPASAEPARPVPAPAPAQLPDTPGLFEIQMADKDFDAGKFLDGARAAYGMIVTAFEKGDRDALKPLVSPEVLEGFSTAITARGTAPARFNFGAVREARLTSASVHDGLMEITVAFTAAFETAEGVGAPHEVTDRWTFQRTVGTADPNWSLVATAGEEQ